MRPILIVLILACGGTPGPSGTVAQADLLVQPADSGRTLVIPSPGATLQLAAYRYESSPYGGSGLQKLDATWSSSAPAVATVSGEGLVTAVASGTAVITAHAGGESGAATVTVGGGSGTSGR